MSTIAVVILNYNGKSFLEKFLPTVVQHSTHAHIVVADNASCDGSQQFLKDYFPKIECINLDQNYGFCEGYNRALKKVKADYYVLLNSDVAVTENWLAPLQELLDEQAMAAAVQPKILSYHKPTHFEYAGAAGGFIDSLGYPFCRGRIFDHVEQDTGQYNDSTEVFWATGACMMVRATAFWKLGGLDADFFAHMEEIDLCWRLKHQGYSVHYVGSSTVYHFGGGTLATSHPFKTKLNFRNGLYLLLKNLPAKQLIWKLPLRLLLDYVAALRFIFKLEFTHAKAVLNAHGEAAKNARLMWSKRPTQVKPVAGTYNHLLVWRYFIQKKRTVELTKSPK